MSLDGTNFFYTNPLRVTDPLPTTLRWPRERVPFLGSFCCPPNLVRTIAGSAQFAYAKSADTIWVNLYGASELETELPGGGKVKLTQETEYPWNGRVRIKILSAPENEFAFKLRIPGWAKDATARVNLGPGSSGRESAQTSPQNNQSLTSAATYHEIRRAWKSGDIIDLDLRMDTELIEAHPLVEETLGQVAVKRGPIVYCLESPDLPNGFRVSDIMVPAAATFRARYDQRLLGGVVVLDTILRAKSAVPWRNQLYREFTAPTNQTIKTKLIPYSVWANRGKSEMSVWLPVTGP
jgi:DUF1680 family protein